MQNLLKSHGTIHQQSCPHTLQQNGVAERKQRHMLDVTRSLLQTSFAPKSYWAEAVHTAALLINITPSSATSDQSSYSRLHGSSFNYSLLRTFGCVALFFFLLTSETNCLPSQVNTFFLATV